MAGETTTTMAGETTTTVAAGPEPPAQDKFVIGGARPISGIYAMFEQAHFGPAYKMWVDDMNAAGGITIAGKKLPVELIVYDDQSDLDTCMRLMTKLMEEDKVDWLLGPQSTAFLFAGAGLAAVARVHPVQCRGRRDHARGRDGEGQLCPSSSSSSTTPTTTRCRCSRRSCRNWARRPPPSAISTTCTASNTTAQAQVFFSTAGIDILSSTAIPAGIKDVSSIVKKWADEQADVICSFQYPNETILTLQTLMQLDYNPKAFLGGPGTSTEAIYNIFAGAADGCMFEGAWTPAQSPEVKAYYDRLVTFVEDKANVDFWGPLIYRAELEFIQQAIEQAGTLKHEAIAEVLRTAHFKTLMSDDMFMTNQILDRSCYAGQIGQWQNGFPQIIDPAPKRTAKEIWYPKPTWKEAPAMSTTSTSLPLGGGFSTRGKQSKRLSKPPGARRRARPRGGIPVQNVLSTMQM